MLHVQEYTCVILEQYEATLTQLSTCDLFRGASFHAILKPCKCIVLPGTGPVLLSAELEQFAAPARLNDSAPTQFFRLKLGEIQPHTHKGVCVQILAKLHEKGDISSKIPSLHNLKVEVFVSHFQLLQRKGSPEHDI